MKTCPACATEVEDSYSFCPEDGSSLGSLADAPAMKGPTAGCEQDNEVNGAVVLHCPTCAAEYPLTFTHCPVHYVRLTKDIITKKTEVDPSADIEDAVSRPASVRLLEAPEALSEPQQSGLERPAFRRAAIATVVGLALVGVVGLYAFISHLSRRPARVAQVATHSEAEPVPFIETPLAAQNYAEEQPSHSSQMAWDRSEEQASRIPPATQKTERGASSSARHETSKTTVVQAPPRTPAAPKKATASSPFPPDLPRAASPGFDSRLVSLQGRRTPLGYRYDLTFNMQERAGHWAQWQRVLITTKSASGVSRSEAIPFAHRLGATGALTFTISVEMSGRSETDWRGRVACTTLGWDQNGAPLQAGFGASVSP